MVGGLEPADLPRHGAGEGAAFMSKELAFDERARNRGAADPDHLALSLRAHLVNRLGEEFFPDTRLAKQEDRGRHRRHLLGLCKCVPDA